MLGNPKSESPFGASIGGQNETLIKIKDDADSKNASFFFLVTRCSLQYFCLNATICRMCVLLSAHSSQFPQIYHSVFYDITTVATNSESCTHRSFSVWYAVMLELPFPSMIETI